MIKWIRSIINLTKIVPRVSSVEWSKEDQAQLATFLRNTGAGVRLLHTLRQGLLENSFDSMTKKTGDAALHGAGFNAGYAAALATIDQLSGADGTDFEEQEE